jgi:serine/threonine-protein kinase
MISEPVPSPDRERLLDDVIAGYLESEERGQPIDRHKLLALYPDLADELAAFFADQDRFGSLVSPLLDTGSRNSLRATSAQVDRLVGVQPPSAGQRFGDYELLGEVARGGMGVVFKARQISLNRVVALKMILAGQLATSDEVQRFRLEAAAAAQLDHPHIVPIYEVGECGGQHYFSMKLIEGGNFTTAGRSTPLAARKQREIAQLLATVARAVHYAHQRGILHRDLKPANILLDVQGEPHVTDFGLARRMESEASLTQSGAIVGTPSYMAPEQASGQKGLTTAADVYSLGAILYELLTGKPPFRAETPLQTLLLVREQEPTRPRSLIPEVDRDLETICLKCLAKEPQKRFGSAEALAEDLERWINGEPIQARRAGRLERGWRWCKRQPLFAATLGLLLVVFLGGFGLVGWQWQRAEANFEEGQKHLQTAEDQKTLAEKREGEAEKERQRAQQEKTRAEELRQLAEQRFVQAHAVVKEFGFKLSENQLRRIPGMEPFRKRILQDVIKYYRELIKQKEDPKLRLDAADAYHCLGSIIASIGLRVEAWKEYEQGLRLYEELLRGTPRDQKLRRERGLLLLHMGQLKRDVGAWAEAVDLMGRSRNALEELCRDYPENATHRSEMLAVAMNLANLHLERGHLKEAENFFKQTQEVRERLVKQDPKSLTFRGELAVFYYDYANIQSQLGRRAEAIRYLKMAHDINNKLAEENKSEPKIWRALALDLRAWGSEEGLAGAAAAGQKKLEKAQEILERLIKQSNKNLVQYLVDLAEVHRTLGYVHIKLKDKVKAAASHQEAIKLMEQAVKRQPDQTEHLAVLAHCCHDLGAMYNNEGQWDKALLLLERARNLRERLVKLEVDSVAYRRDLAATAHSTGVVLWNMGRKEEAFTRLEEASQQFREALEAAPPYLRTRRALDKHYTTLAKLQQVTRKLDEAVATLQERARLWPNNAGELFMVARDVALTAEYAGKGKANLNAEEQEQRNRCAAAAVELLHQAVAAGFKDGKRLQKDVAFNVLRSREDFQAIMIGLPAGGSPPK